MKKSFLFSLALLLSSTFVVAQTYSVSDEASTVQFKIKNFGFNVDGSFKGLKGTIEFDPANAAAAKFNVSVDANTVYTDNDMRDNHLREDTYFDVKNHPRISFVSTSVSASNKARTFIISGNLEMKGITKPISFPFTMAAINGGFVFNGEFKINRRDFQVGGSSTLSDNVNIILNVTVKK